MSGHGPVVGLGGALGNVDRAAQLALTVHHRQPSWSAVRPARPQELGELFAKRATGLDEQREVDGLVRHAHLRLVGVARRSQPEICCGDQRSSSFASTTSRRRPQVASFAGLGRRAIRSAARSAGAPDNGRPRCWPAPPARSSTQNVPGHRRSRDRTARSSARWRSPRARPPTAATPSASALSLPAAPMRSGLDESHTATCESPAEASRPTHPHQQVQRLRRLSLSEIRIDATPPIHDPTGSGQVLR